MLGAQHAHEALGASFDLPTVWVVYNGTTSFYPLPYGLCSQTTGPGKNAVALFTLNIATKT